MIRVHVQTIALRDFLQEEGTRYGHARHADGLSSRSAGRFVPSVRAVRVTGP